MIRVWLVLLVTMELCRARLRLVWSGEQHVLAILQSGERPGARLPSPSNRDWLAQIAWAIGGMVERLPFRTDCLVRLMAAQALLERRQISYATRVQIGRNAVGEFEAHCWIDVAGSPVIGGPIRGYHPLPDIAVIPDL